MMLGILFYVLNLVLFVSCDWSRDQEELRWNSEASKTIDEILNQQLNKNVAKNVILFLGDGMGISTVTAGRIRKGQLINGENGEEFVTNMEKLPHLALAKTYNIDAQTPDSAGTATAYLSGVKTRAGILGLNGHAEILNCQSSHNTKVESILDWAHKAGKSVGIVTTTRITHATPAAAYAHSPFRHWEAFDGVKFTQNISDQGCKDIADQLISENYFIDLLIGGGRKTFLPNDTTDYFLNQTGSRIDNRNLIQEWEEKMISLNKTYKFIWNASDFRNTSLKEYDHVLALLSYDHLAYEIDRNPDEEPSLTELTKKAIEMLEKNENGYFLLVEGGRIDHGHHENKAHKSLDDFVAFDYAIGNASSIVSEKDTLVVVTADHSHTFTLGGSSWRGNGIYGIVKSGYQNLSDSNLTFTSILYGNGPGGLLEIRTKNLTDEQTEDKNYVQEAAVYKKMATHGAEDVAVYSRGPMSFLFTKTVEQNFVAHAMAYSACIGPYDSQRCLNNRGVLKNPTRRSSQNSESTSSALTQFKLSHLNFLASLGFFVLIFRN